VINLRRSIVLSILGLLVPRPGPSARGQDRATVVPEMKVLLENERVRVQFHDVKVGEKTPLHSHPSYVAYVFSPYKARFVLADGSVKTAERKAGDVFFSGPVIHSVENIGNTPVHNLIVELKGGEAAGSRPYERIAEGPPPVGSS
jgi:beta-alanine degradation protein BauB